MNIDLNALESTLNEIASSTDVLHDRFLQTEKALLNAEPRETGEEAYIDMTDFQTLFHSDDLKSNNMADILGAFAESNGFSDGKMNIEEGMTAVAEMLYSPKDQITVDNDGELTVLDKSMSSDEYYDSLAQSIKDDSVSWDEVSAIIERDSPQTKPIDDEPEKDKTEQIENKSSDTSRMIDAAKKASEQPSIDTSDLPFGSEDEEVTTDDAGDDVYDIEANIINEADESEQIIEYNEDFVPTEEMISEESTNEDATTTETEDPKAKETAELKTYEKYDSLIEAISGMDEKDQSYAEHLVSNLEKGFIPLEMRPYSFNSDFIKKYPDFKLSNDDIKNIAKSDTSSDISPRLSGKYFGFFMGCKTQETNYLTNDNITSSYRKDAKDFKEDLQKYYDPSEYDKVDHIYVNVDAFVHKLDKLEDYTVGDTTISGFQPFAVYTIEVHTFDPETHTRDIEYKSFIGNTNGDIYTSVPDSGSAPIAILNKCEELATISFDGKVTPEVEDFIIYRSETDINAACNYEAHITRDYSSIYDNFSKEELQNIKDIAKTNLDVVYAKNTMETEGILSDYKDIHDMALDIANDIKVLDNFAPDSTEYKELQAKIDDEKAEFEEKFNAFLTDNPDAKEIVTDNREELKYAVDTYKDSTDFISRAEITVDFKQSEYVTGVDKDGNPMDSRERLNGLINRDTSGSIIVNSLNPYTISDEDLESVREYIRDKVDNWNEQNPDNQLSFDEEDCKIYDKHGIERSIQSETGSYDRTFNADYVKDGEAHPEPNATTGEVGINEIEEFEEKNDVSAYKDWGEDFKVSDINVDYEPDNYMSVIEGFLPKEEEIEDEKPNNDRVIHEQKRTDSKVDSRRVDNDSASVSRRKSDGNKDFTRHNHYNEKGKVELSQDKKDKLRKEAEAAVGKNMTPEQRKAEVERIYKQKVEKAEVKLNDIARQIRSSNFEIKSRKEILGPVVSRSNYVHCRQEYYLNDLYKDFKKAGGEIGKDSIVTSIPNVFQEYGDVKALLASVRFLPLTTPISELYYRSHRPDNPYKNNVTNDQNNNATNDDKKDNSTKDTDNEKSGIIEKVLNALGVGKADAGVTAVEVMDSGKEPVANEQLNDNADSVDSEDIKDTEKKEDTDVVSEEGTTETVNDEADDIDDVEQGESDNPDDTTNDEQSSDIEEKQQDEDISDDDLSKEDEDKDIENDSESIDKEETAFDEEDYQPSDVDNGDEDNEDSVTDDEQPQEEMTEEESEGSQDEVASDDSTAQYEPVDKDTDEEDTDETSKEDDKTEKEDLETAKDDKSTDDEKEDDDKVVAEDEETPVTEERDTEPLAEEDSEPKDVDNENDSDDTEKGEPLAKEDVKKTDDAAIIASAEDENEPVEDENDKDKEEIDLKEKLDDYFKDRDEIFDTLNDVVRDKDEDAKDEILSSMADYMNDNLSDLMEMEDLAEKLGDLGTEIGNALETNTFENRSDFEDDFKDTLTNDTDVPEDIISDAMSRIEENDAIPSDLEEDAGSIDGYDIDEIDMYSDDSSIDNIENTLMEDPIGDSDIDASLSNDVSESDFADTWYDSDALSDFDNEAKNTIIDDAYDNYSNNDNVSENDAISQAISDYNTNSETTNDNYNDTNNDSYDDISRNIDSGSDLGDDTNWFNDTDYTNYSNDISENVTNSLANDFSNDSVEVNSGMSTEDMNGGYDDTDSSDFDDFGGNIE